MSDIFISYARSTVAEAQAVADALRASGYRVWVDDELPAHRAYAEVIEERLREARAVVVIWSAAAVKSQWVRAEADFARQAGTLVQVTVDGAAPRLPFNQIQCADLRGWTGALEAPAWRKVLASIAELTGDPAPPTGASNASPVRKDSICVLPFTNISGDVEQEYFSDGISEDIITDLSKVSALFVIARNTAFTFKGRSVDVTQVARHLRVSYVLEGSVRKAGGRVRITAQLTDGATGGHVWAERYDRDLTDIFALQDDIAHAIVSALRLKLLPDERTGIELRRPNNLDAYDLYLRGTRPTFAPEEMRAEIALLEAATRLAPDYADAWGALAHTRSNWLFSRPYSERAEVAALVRSEAEQALELEPHNAAAMWAQLNLLPPFGRFAEREDVIDRMERHGLRDSRSIYLRSAHLANVGRLREAIEVAQRAYDLNPVDPAASNWLGLTLFGGGRYAEARHCFEATLARWPDSHYAAINVILVCVQTQDWATIDALLAPERLAKFPLRENERAMRGHVSVMRDASPASRRRPIDAARRRFETSGYADLYQLQLAAEVGYPDDAHAIAALARFGPAGTPRDQMGTDAYRPGPLFYASSPRFRRDPRFVRLCARLGLVDYWLTSQQWPDCVDEVAPYYDFKAECARIGAGPPLPPANDTGLFA